MEPRSKQSGNSARAGWQQTPAADPNGDSALLALVQLLARQAAREALEAATSDLPASIPDTPCPPHDEPGEEPTS